MSSKLGAQVILCGVLGLKTDLEALPNIDPESVPETVVDAESVRAIDGVQLEMYDSTV